MDHHSNWYQASWEAPRRGQVSRGLGSPREGQGTSAFLLLPVLLGKLRHGLALPAGTCASPQCLTGLGQPCCHPPLPGGSSGCPPPLPGGPTQVLGYNGELKLSSGTQTTLLIALGWGQALSGSLRACSAPRVTPFLAPVGAARLGDILVSRWPSPWLCPRRSPSAP